MVAAIPDRRTRLPRCTRSARHLTLPLVRQECSQKVNCRKAAAFRRRVRSRERFKILLDVRAVFIGLSTRTSHEKPFSTATSQFRRTAKMSPGCNQQPRPRPNRLTSARPLANNPRSRSTSPAPASELTPIPRGRQIRKRSRSFRQPDRHPSNDSFGFPPRMDLLRKSSPS